MPKYSKREMDDSDEEEGSVSNFSIIGKKRSRSVMEDSDVHLNLPDLNKVYKTPSYIVVDLLDEVLPISEFAKKLHVEKPVAKRIRRATAKVLGSLSRKKLLFRILKEAEITTKQLDRWLIEVGNVKVFIDGVNLLRFKNELSVWSSKRRRTKKKTLKENREEYFKHLDSQLHEEKWVVDQVKKFSKKQAQYELIYCSQCQERWFGGCTKCTDFKRKNKVNLYGKINDMLPGHIPSWSQGLTEVEILLCSPVLATMSIYRLRGGQYGSTGNTIHFAQKLQPIADRLPNLPENLPIVIIVPNGTSLNEVKRIKCRRAIVERFLKKCIELKMPGFEYISINKQVLNRLPENGILPELKEKIFKRYEDYVETKENIDEEDREHESIIPGEISRKKEKKSVKDTFGEIQFPERESSPLSEFRVECLAAKSFPHLFTGNWKCDPTYKVRRKTITWRQGIQHLLKCSDFRSNGSVYYPFAADKRFKFWAFNLLRRHESLKQANFFINEYPEEIGRTVEDIIGECKKKGVPSFISKISRVCSKIIGGAAFWQKNKRQLRSLFSGEGVTIFATMSYADFHCADLHRLLGTENKSRSEKIKAIVENGHIVAAYFHRRMKDWYRVFNQHILDADWWWSRVEFQSRGTIHLHMCMKLKSDPNLRDYCLDAYRGRKAAATLEKTSVSLEKKKQLMKLVELGKRREEYVVKYCDCLISTWNTLEEKEVENFEVPNIHPASKRFHEIDEKDYKQDFTECINTFQRHFKCSPIHCLRKDKNSKIEKCRFDFPKSKISRTQLVFKETDNGIPEVSIETKRNDERLNNFNRLQMVGLRCNCDIQIVLDAYQAISYLAKYTAKAECRSVTTSKIMSQIAERYRGTNNLKTLFRSMIIRSSGQRDVSAQEVCYQLLGLPLVSCPQFDFLTLNLRYNSRRVQKRGAGIQLSYSWLDIYGKRMQTEKPTTALKMLNLDQFLKTYKTNNRMENFHLIERTRRVSITYYPNVSPHADLSTYCKYELLKYKPWVGSFQNVHNNKSKKQIIEEYEKFVNSNYAKLNCTSLVRQRAKIGKIIVENEEYAFEKEEEEEWMSLIKPPKNVKVKNDEDSIVNIKLEDLPSTDWDKFRKMYTKEQYNLLTEFIEGLKQKQSCKNLLIVTEEDLIGKQKVAYEIVKKSLENDERIMLLILGTAGTGKSYVIGALRNLLKEKCIVLGTSGVAAYNINGKTMHSVLKLPVCGKFLGDLKENNCKKLQEVVNDEKVKYIIVDEVSMMGRKSLYWINRRLQQASGKRNIECGGFSLIFVGDFGQLPPVCDVPIYINVDSYVEVNMLYQSFLENVVMLDVIHRQLGKQNKRFKKLLLHLREGKFTHNDWELIKTRSPEVATNVKEFNSAIRLFSVNAPVNEYNMKCIKNIWKNVAVIDAVHSDSVAKKARPEEARSLQSRLVLCHGARVMLRLNLLADVGLINGALGTVLHIIYKPNSKPPELPVAVLVKMDKLEGQSFLFNVDNVVPIVPVKASWVDRFGNSRSRTQLPLTLSWATTIHKSQGLTLDKAWVDIGDCERQAGLTFVAFSRVRKLEDLIIVGKSFDRYLKIGSAKGLQRRIEEEKKLKYLSK